MNTTQYKHIQKIAQQFVIINDQDVKQIVWDDMHNKYGDAWDKTYIMVISKNTEIIPNVLTIMKTMGVPLKQVNKLQFKQACKTFYKG